MFKLNRLRIFIGATLLFTPFTCYADGIVPLLNLFTKDTAGSAAILTVFIVLVEALLLRKFIKSVSFKIHLARVTIFNALSSAAGSVVVILFLKEQMTWKISDLYLPMFLLTVVVETPMLKHLYRRENFNWLRSIKFSTGINLVSYTLLFVGQFGVAIGFIFFGDFLDKQTIKNWTDLSIFNGESGYIYTVKSKSDNNSNFVIKRYDVEKNNWDIIDPGFEKGIRPDIWDIQGNILVCVEKKDDFNNTDQPLLIFNTQTLSKITEIKIDRKSKVMISPDLTKLAVLVFERQLNAPKDSESHYMLGSVNKIKVYDIGTGKLLSEVPRLATDNGLTWLNSDKVIFSSYREESLLTDTNEYQGMGYGTYYAPPHQFPIDLFVFNLETGLVRQLGEGRYPNVTPTKNEINYLKETGKYKGEIRRTNLDFNESQILLKEAYDSPYAISPSGKRFLILVPHKEPLRNSKFLTVLSDEEPLKKFIIDPNYYFYGFRWVEK